MLFSEITVLFLAEPLRATKEVIFTCGCDPADKVGYFKANSNDMDGSKTQPTLRTFVFDKRPLKARTH